MVIRRFESGDLDELAAMWHASKRDAFPYVAVQQAYTIEDDRQFLHDRLLPTCQIWVAEQGGAIVGFVALNGSLVEELFVAVGRQGEGIGSALLAKARELSPAGLSLYAFQRNAAARAFYEQHGFVAAQFGVSPAPENEPDVKYLWAPAEKDLSAGPGD